MYRLECSIVHYIAVHCIDCETCDSASWPRRVRSHKTLEVTKRPGVRGNIRGNIRAARKSSFVTQGNAVDGWMEGWTETSLIWIRCFSDTRMSYRVWCIFFEKEGKSTGGNSCAHLGLQLAGNLLLASAERNRVTMSWKWQHPNKLQIWVVGHSLRN